MAKIVKTLTVSWQWSGDKYSLRGFNLAVTPTAKNPKEEVVATAFVETKEIKQTYSYKMGNVTLDKDAQYKIWVQAVYENSDSDWVSTGGATVTDDGSATIITKTDREIQDIVNMASDNILTRQEKIGLRREWQEIVYEFLEIESTAISQGIPSSNTTFSNFKSKGNALGTYLNGGATWTISSSNKTSFPLWINDSNLASNTSINGNTYRETFRVYYEAKVKILEEINKYKVNNVQVGGINLLMGTKDFNVGKGSGTIHSENYKGFSVLHKDMSSATSGTSDVCIWSNAIDVKQNTEYTLSFYAKGSGSFSSYFYPNNVASGYSSEGKKTTASDGALTHTLTSNWKKYWITWKTSASTTGLKNVLPMRLLAGGVGYICGVKFEEGNKATDWSPSLEEMENAYTIILTNEAQVIPTNSNRVPTSSTTYFTDIQVYQGTVQRNDYTIGTINSANGITVSKTSSRVNFAVSTNTALAADGGNFVIPITIDGKTFNKTFSWSCSKQGDKGDNAKNVTLTATSQVFKSTDGGQTFTPDNVTIKATYQNVTHSKWQHSVDGGKTFVDTGTNTNGVTINNNGFTISKNSTLFNSNVTSIVVKVVTSDSSITDTMTITRLYDVTGIEVGGRNYVQDYKFQRQDIWKKNVGSVITIDNDNGWVVLNESTSNPYVYQFFDVSTFKAGEPLTLQYEIKCEGVSANTATNSMLVQTVLTGYESDKTFIGDKVNFGSHANNVANLTEWTKCTFTKNLPNDFTGIGFFAIRLYARNFRGKVYYRNVKLEKGNVATDLSPAPEDAELNIDDVKNNLSSFQTTVNGAFKDGIIEQAEAKAIASHIQILDAEKADVDKEYSTIYNNSALNGTAKTNLKSAKTEFDNAHKSLKSTINTVIADGKVTSSEKTSVDSTFSTYNSILGTYRQRVQEALDYISTAKITDVQVGGTNLAIGTNQGSSRWGWSLQEGDKTVSSEVIDGVNCVKLVKGNTTPHSGWNYVSYNKFAREKITPNTTYTASFEIKSNKTFDVGGIDLKYGDSTNTLITSSKAVKKSVKANSDWTKIIFELKTKDVLPSATGQCIYITGISATDGNIHYIRNLQLEKGNKATDWSPAVEDLENAYTIVLTNEAQVIPTNNSRVPTTSTTYYTDIVVYQGTTQRTDYTIGTINGANGITVSKTSSRVNFAVSTGTALTADGGNFTIPITIDGKTFNKTFSWSCSKQGSTGNTGNGINTITEYYAVSSSNTTAPTSWSTTVPNMTSTNKYLWNYEVIKYTDNTTKETAKRVIGAYGDKGATGSTGATGATGNGISKITNYYLASSSSSGVTTSTSGWTTSVQSVSSSKKYLWNYEVVTYTNGSTTTTTPCIIGAYGDTGDGAKTVSLTSSSQVFKSTDGGLTFTPDNIVITPSYQNVSYSKWQYSTNGGSSWTDVSSSTNGVTYSSTSLTLSKSSTLFTDKITSIIFKIITNNSAVTDTITIIRLYDVTDINIGGRNLLVNTDIDYLNDLNVYNPPSDLTTSIVDKWRRFNITTQLNGREVVHNHWYTPTDLSTYTFSIECRTDATSLSIPNISLFTNAIGHFNNPTKIIKLSNGHYKITSTFDLSKVPTGYTLGTPIRIVDLRAVTTSGATYIEFRYPKLEKGNKATDWTPSVEELENAYSIILTNEAQVIPTNSSRIPTSNATYTTDIQVYQGTTQRTDYTIGTINSANGITVSKTSSRVNFAVSTGTAITADGGNFTIPITIDGKTFNKTFSWSCSKQGNTGATGNAGQDAITIILSNENHTFPCESNGNIPTALSTTCVVTAYKGATSVTPTIGSITNPTGMTISKNGATLTIQANTGTSLADSGTVNIPITVDGKTFNKTFTWSKAKKGAEAKTADIITSSQVFKSTDGGLTFSPTTIKLTPKLQNVTYSNWQYSTNGGSSWTNVVSGEKGMSIDSSNKALTVSKDSSVYTDSVTSVVFRLNTSDSSVYDTMTIVKLYDVADLEIGTRNLLLDTALLQGSKHWSIGGKWSITNAETDKPTNKIAYFKNTDSSSTWQRFSTKVNLPVTPNDKLTFSFDVKVISDLAKLDERMVIIRFYDTDTTDDYSDAGSFSKIHLGRGDFSVINAKNTWYTVSKTFTVPTGAKRMCIGFQVYQDGEAKFRCLKLEKGNKATDWTPAPEDVNSNINDVKDSLNSFQNTVNTSFKDGIIEQAEAKAIAQHLKTLDAEKADIDKEYSTIYSNANLTGSAKTNLASAKTSFDSAHTSLKSTINTVISDGKVTSSESASVTSTFNTYNTQLGVYKQRVQEALDNISSGKVDKVEIGGRNLARKGSVVKYNSNGSATTVNDANFTTDGSATISRTAVTNEGAMIDRYVVYDGGANYVAAFKMRTTSGTVNSIHFYNGRGHKNSKVYIDGAYKGTMGQDLTFPNDTNYHKVEVQFEAVATDSSTANAQNTQHIIPQPMKGTASAYTIQILNLKIEKGNKATDWTPAPEDVKNHAEQSAQDAVNAQTQNSIFNKLTNNGQTQGIYLENSKIYINGEYIKANTLSADKVLVGDYTNYCQLTEQTPMSDKFNKYTHSDSTIWHEMKTLNRDTRVSRDYSCKGGEKFRVTGYVYGKVTSMTSNGGSTSQENTKFRVGIFGTKTDGSKFYYYGDDNTGSSTGSVVQFSKIVTLPSDAKSFYVVLHLDGWTPMSGVARCRNIEVRRMNTGELIVDGSITANHITSRSITADRIKAGAITANEIAAGTITVDKINANVLSASTIVSTINGGSTNISGNRIRTGSISSNNGKSTINLDNGSMNLGTTSDASYLQWTGSALNIKANSISIGTTSVATTTQLTEKIDGIQVGGRNLIKNSNKRLNSKTPTSVQLGGVVDYQKLKGKTITLSMDINVSGMTNASGERNRVGFEFSMTHSDDTTTHIGIWHYVSDGNYNGRKVRTFTVPNKDIKSLGYNGLYMQCNATSCDMGNVKLEEGNKATSWSPAPEDVNAAINNKANSADVYKKSEVYTQTETNTQITTAKNEINQSVSSTYETKTNVTNKINNLTVSATNLLDNSAPLSTNGWSNWSSVSGLSTNMEVSTTDNSTHGKQGKITFSGSVTGTAGRHRFPVQKLTAGKTYSWSVWLRSGSGNLTVSVGQEQNGRREVSVGTSWTRFTHTYTADDNQYYTFYIRPKNVTSSHSLYFHSVMLVEGDKPVAWQTSPTEVLSDKTNIEQRMTSAESKITDTAITNTVKKNFYTKEETNNQITSKGYQTSSQVQQTVNNLQIKFAESGGYNLFLNSGFKKGTNYWGTHTHNSPTGGSIGITTSTGDWGFPDASVNCVHIRLVNQSGIEYGISQAVKTTIGKKYTLSFYYAGHRLNQANAIVRNTNGSWLANKYINSFPTGGNGNANNWNKYTLTFTATATSHSINIVIVSAGDNGYMWVAKPQVVEGELDLPYSPNPNEVYDGLTTIDKDGIKVSTSRGAYTQFSADGMSSFNNSSQQTLGIKNGGITFHPYSSSQLGAYITQSALWGGSASANGLAISTANNGTYIALGTSSLSDANTTLNMDQALTISSNDNFQPIGINFWKDAHAHGYGIRQLSHLKLAGSGAIEFDYLNNSPSTIYEAVDSGHSLYVMGGYQMHLGCMDGKGVPKGVIWIKSSTATHSYTHWDFHNYTMYNMKTASSFINTASHRATESYGVTSNVDGVRYLYRDVELIEGKAIRSIPNGYRGCTYDIVSIVCKGRGSAWVETEDENRFEINGDCKSVNIEIIIYPSEDVMAASTQQLEEPPTLELPKKTEPEEALLITNEAI